jgi:hypothetical protein
MSVPHASDLDDAFLSVVRSWSAGGVGCDEHRFDELALATFAYQRAHNLAYARYAAALGYAGERMPDSWRDVPAVPASAFKDATLATFDILGAELEFHTSGTTAANAGKHYVERAALYDAALLAGFDRFMLPDRPKLRYLNLVPNPRQHPHSSLGYMMGHVSVLRGDGKATYALEDGIVNVDSFSRAIASACADGQAVCIAGTAFAFVALLEALEAAATAFAAPAGSRIMETGGFKGRVRAIERDELYTRLEAALGVPRRNVVAEYGMTELVSQFYDSPESRERDVRVKVSPPWLRTLVVDERGNALPDGETGFLRHVDLGNRSSALAIQTEDRGYRVPGGGIVLLGRAVDAPVRGCSLDAEDLRSLAAAALRG